MELRKLRLLVRNGLPLESATGSSGQFQSEIQRVLSGLEPLKPRFSLLESLMYQSLVAEYHAMLGRIDDAIHTLKPKEGKAEADEILKALDASSEEGRPQLPEIYLSDRKLLRQAIWLLMNYLFFRFYEKNLHERGLHHFNQLEPVILHDLKTDDYVPHGTLSRLYYYRSHCLRGLRRFPEAEQDLLLSQEHADKRLQNKLKLSEPSPNHERGKPANDSPSTRSEHRDFAVICTARILGLGFGWMELNRGRLTKAKRLLLAADTLLLPTGHAAMKQLVRFLLALIDRRQTKPGSPDYQEAMREIENQLRTYQDMQSSVGQLRAVQELARGYLDWLDSLIWSLDDGHPVLERTRLLGKAEQFTYAFRKLSAHASLHWRCRYQLMHVRLACHQEGAPENVIPKVHAIRSSIASQPDLGIEYQILCGYVFNRLGKYAPAIDALLTVLGRIETDPLLEAEVRLLLTESFARTNDFVRADKERTRWSVLGQNIQNRYLQDLQTYVDHILAEAKRPFHIPFEADLNRKQRHKELDIWLEEAAQKRLSNPTDANVRKLLGTSRATAGRIRRGLPNAVKSIKR